MFWRRKDPPPYVPGPTSIFFLERVLIGSIIALGVAAFIAGYSWGHP